MVIMCVLQGGKLPGLNAISGSFTSKTMLWAMSLTPCRVRSRKQTTSTDWKLPLLVSAPDVYVSVFSRKEKRELTSELRQTQLERIQVTVSTSPWHPWGKQPSPLRFWAHPHTLPLSKRLEAGCGTGSDFVLGEFYITISYCTEIILTNESWMQGERSSSDIKKKLQDKHELLQSPLFHRILQSGPWWGSPRLHRLTTRISTCNPLLLGKVYNLGISQWASLSK